jgi:hypothetical protein
MTPQAHLVFGLLVLGGLLSIVVSLLIAAATASSPKKRPHSQRLVRYRHHGREVVVRADLKGKHRDHCLCYGCGKYPGCPIAKAVFDNCVKFDLVTPVWECPDFERLPALEKRADAGLHV